MAHLSVSAWAPGISLSLPLFLVFSATELLILIQFCFCDGNSSLSPTKKKERKTSLRAFTLLAACAFFWSSYCLFVKVSSVLLGGSFTILDNDNAIWYRIEAFYSKLTRYTQILLKAGMSARHYSEVQCLGSMSQGLHTLVPDFLSPHWWQPYE